MYIQNYVKTAYIFIYFHKQIWNELKKETKKYPRRLSLFISQPYQTQDAQ